MDLQAPERRELILQAAVTQGLLHAEEALVAAFIDLDELKTNVQNLKLAFPGDTLHAFAAKANCLVPVLSMLKDMGMGCEVASEGELAQALAAGFAPDMIVFDSPAKTRRELRQALSAGVAINADNFDELDRLRQLLGKSSSRSKIGIRINPQVGLGGIEAMSTAGATSKFGIPLMDLDNRERLINAYQKNPWISRVHAHVGSQGCPLPLIANGIARVVEFADEVNDKLGRQHITTIDIGGGLPVDFDSENMESGFETYVQELMKTVPSLLSGKYKIVTEFGRAILAKFGFMAAYVEYTKISGGSRIAITHAGAHMAARTVFMPEAWPIRVQAHDGLGRRKHESPISQNIAGPCCFAGDMIAREQPLPALKPGDLITLLDTGAYYFSTPFSYNSLLEPGVYGATIETDEAVRFTTLRRPQSVSDLLNRTGINELPSPSARPGSTT